MRIVMSNLEIAKRVIKADIMQDESLNIPERVYLLKEMEDNPKAVLVQLKGLKEVLDKAIEELENNVTTREEEYQIVKNLIKQFYDQANGGLFDTKNTTGDPMDNLYDGRFFRLDICYNMMYFEVFGTTIKEFRALEKFYNKLEKERKKNEQRA